MSKKVCFLFNKSGDENDTLDGLRSTLGLAVANHYGYAVIMNHELGPLSEYHSENIDWIRDMEGEVFSTDGGNVEKHGFTAMNLEEVAKKILEVDVVVPYGTED